MKRVIFYIKMNQYAFAGRVLDVWYDKPLQLEWILGGGLLMTSEWSDGFIQRLKRFTTVLALDSHILWPAHSNERTSFRPMRHQPPGYIIPVMPAMHIAGICCHCIAHETGGYGGLAFVSKILDVPSHCAANNETYWQSQWKLEDWHSENCKLT